MAENNKPKIIIDNTQKQIQEQKELYKYITYIEEKTLTIIDDVGIDNLTEKLNKLSNFVEKFEEKTSSHQELLLNHVEKSDGARMYIKDDIQSEIRLITEKMDKINEANLNIPKLSAPSSHIRSPVKPKEEEQEKELEETIFPRAQDSKNSKRCHRQCFQHGHNLDGIQQQRGTNKETIPFTKGMTLPPDTANT
ncbi:hypothetical protein O181_004202 [Austropuccinia psidii MF-1]|uniref:Uncharacterized protein n=1 Tax=Austropuccinia psidii MF-1 TaxID=1389203 RepID=A0A9Q3GFJ8_9BASI|nr:hypothetical protein [Austropuccinia psidii MF-1]